MVSERKRRGSVECIGGGLVDGWGSGGFMDSAWFNANCLKGLSKNCTDRLGAQIRQAVGTYLA